MPQIMCCCAQAVAAPLLWQHSVDSAMQTVHRMSMHSSALLSSRPSGSNMDGDLRDVVRSSLVWFADYVGGPPEVVNRSASQFFRNRVTSLPWLTADQRLPALTGKPFAVMMLH